MPSRRNAMSRVKKSMKNATVDLSVQRRRIVVKMNHPCYIVNLDLWKLREIRTHHKEKTEGVQETNTAIRSFNRRNNIEASGCQHDGKSKPETTI
jgi:hypothetical protein